MEGPRRFGFLTLPNYSMIACANAVEALRMANRVAGTEVFGWRVVTLDGAPAPASNGLALAPTVRLAAAGPLDLAFVCGGVDVRHAAGRPVTAALRRLAREGVALGALCTGAFTLAEAGLLEGYRCAIHWENLPAIREEFPQIEFVDDLYAIDRDRLTCTGGVAPLHMMLALIESRLGRGPAERVSEQFILERARAGGEPQPSLSRSFGLKGQPRLAEAVRLIEAHVERPLSIAEIAQAAGLSTRQLERLFRQRLNATPGGYAVALRLDRARNLLRQTAMPVTAIGVACGFSSPARFATAYRGRFGHPPRAERNPAVGRVG